MASRLSKLPSKFLPLLFMASLILASFNLPAIFHGKFLNIKNIIEEKSSAVLDKKVHIGDIGFLPYGKVILSDIKIQDKEQPASYMEIERFTAKFSILEFLKNQNVTLNRLKKAKRLDIRGIAIFKRPDFIGQVKYKMNALVTPDVLSIETLLLDFKKFNMEIKGNINHYAESPRAELNIASREIIVSGMGKINNLYGYVKLSKDEIFIKDLDFFVNNFPVGIRCRISGFKTPDIEMDVISYPGQLPSLRPFSPFNFKIHFAGKKIKSSVNGNLVLETQKLISINPREISMARLSMDDLSCIFSNKIISVNVKNILCETSAYQRQLYLRSSDFRAAAYLGKARIYLTGLSLSAYKGLMKGNGFLDFNQWPPKLFLDFKFYKLDVAELARAFKLNYELKGALDFKGVLNNRQDPCLSGRLNITDGYLKDASVLILVSDFLNVPSLKNLYFENISSIASLSLVNKEVIFDKIIISGQDLNLKGDIRFKNTKKINGSISVKLSTALLKESFRLRVLFFLIGEKLPYQDFEFEIGGFANSPHIKWLSTRFRENVMKYLSGGDRKGIENSLEKAIGELAH